mmetsp:Transcript_85325/g.238170  ORF Transcript_85325/g.238170 Transcript_85325/m.238170 type:complete len:203 (-) Transcript_85325:126-734(-)
MRTFGDGRWYTAHAPFFKFSQQITPPRPGILCIPANPNRAPHVALNLGVPPAMLAQSDHPLVGRVLLGRRNSARPITFIFRSNSFGRKSQEHGSEKHLIATTSLSVPQCLDNCLASIQLSECFHPMRRQGVFQEHRFVGCGMPEAEPPSVQEHTPGAKALLHEAICRAATVKLITNDVVVTLLQMTTDLMRLPTFLKAADNE